MKKYEAEQKLKKRQKTTSVHYENHGLPSSIISGNVWNAWHGMETKRFGVKTILLCCAAYLLTCNGFSMNEVVKYSLCIGLTAGWFGLKKTGREVQWHRLRLGTFCTLGVCFAGFIIYVISGNLNGGENLPQMLVFSDSWGTNRGYAWTNTVALFGELPFHQKLIGIGPGAFYDFFEVPNQIRKVPFVDPHSDYLYYLVTTGLIGFIAWFGMIAAGIVSCWKKQTPETITIAAVLIAWMMQAAVNCSIVFTAPYLFAALGIARWQTRELSKEKK